MQEYNWAQEKLNEVTGTKQAERREAQLEQAQSNENRAQRRASARQSGQAIKRLEALLETLEVVHGHNEKLRGRPNDEL